MQATYEKLSEILGDRESRKLKGNTYARRVSDDEIVVELHKTGIVLASSERTELNTGGWFTLTTMERMNYVLEDFRVYTEQGRWKVASRAEPKFDTHYRDGMTLWRYAGVPVCKIPAGPLESDIRDCEKRIEKILRPIKPEMLDDLLAVAGSLDRLPSGYFGPHRAMVTPETLLNAYVYAGAMPRGGTRYISRTYAKKHLRKYFRRIILPDVAYHGQRPLHWFTLMQELIGSKATTPYSPGVTNGR